MPCYSSCRFFIFIFITCLAATSEYEIIIIIETSCRRSGSIRRLRRCRCLGRSREVNRQLESVGGKPYDDRNWHDCGDGRSGQASLGMMELHENSIKITDEQVVVCTERKSQRK